VTRKLLLNDYSEPTPEEMERGLYKSQLIEIDELSNFISGPLEIYLS
jgi:hypothetical protein